MTIDTGESARILVRRTTQQSYCTYEQDTLSPRYPSGDVRGRTYVVLLRSRRESARGDQNRATNEKALHECMDQLPLLEVLRSCLTLEVRPESALHS